MTYCLVKCPPSVNNLAWAINRTNGQGYLFYETGWLTEGEMAFDGQCMWMAGEAGLTTFHTGGLNTCQDGEMVSAMPAGPVAFDEKRVWSASESQSALYWLDTTTGTIGTPITVGKSPSTLIFDGGILWVANSRDALFNSSAIGPRRITFFQSYNPSTRTPPVKNSLAGLTQ